MPKMKSNRGAAKRFSKTPSGEIAFEPGSILVPAGLQTDSNWVSYLNQAQFL